jgi:hypothetical protein
LAAPENIGKHVEFLGGRSRSARFWARPSPGINKNIISRESVMCWSGEASAVLAAVGFGTATYSGFLFKELLCFTYEIIQVIVF